MRERVIAWLKAHPYVCGVLGASAVYLALTLPVGFTFMADDYSHLAAAWRLSDLFSGRFASWLSRVPVWSVLASALFGSHVLERTWAPMYLVFAAHAATIALIVRWLVRELAGPQDAPAVNPWLVSLATAVCILYPNFYEILYWPTCMPYAVGGLFLAAALYSRPIVVRAVLASLAFLTYETFALPALVLMAMPMLARQNTDVSTATRVRMLAKQGAPWLIAAGIMLLTRKVAALFVGGFSHRVNASPKHIAEQALTAAKQLFQIRFIGGHTNVLATAAMLLALAAGLVLLWHRWRWRWSPVGLVLACFASTAVYWVLDYGAMRAIYGAQIALAAVFAWVAIQASRAGTRTLVVAVVLAVVGAGYLVQTAKIMRIKDHNARVLASREQSLRTKIEACGSPCTVEYEPLDAGLMKDWVLHPDYWNSYLDWLAAKYASGKRVEFIAAPFGG